MINAKAGSLFFFFSVAAGRGAPFQRTHAKYKFCLDLFKKWGYTFIDEIVWVKTTVNRRLAKSHGFYLQHAKEGCLVAKKGKEPANLASNVGSDIILA